MKLLKKLVLFGLPIVLILILIAGGWVISNTLPIGTGHAAKTLCSNVFLANREPDTIMREDIVPVHFLFKLVDTEVDREEKSVTATSLGFIKTKAIYRDGCGCTVVNGITEDELRKQSFMNTGPRNVVDQNTANQLWPNGRQGPVVNLPTGVNTVQLAAAMDAAFAEPGPEPKRLTRAVLVIYNGQLIAERYAPGYDSNSSLLGWSMSKSITNALVGILVREKKLDIMQPAPVAEWQNEGDARAKITIDQLLRMSSGLEFNEAYAPFSDAVYMFYDSYDFAAYAAEKPLEVKPEAKWYYSSGTANIVARIVRQKVAKAYSHYYQFLYEELFNKIGMHSAVMEPDPSGTFVGSSYTFATASDWARFGQLYLQDGVWQGERILPEGWVKYTTTPTPASDKGQYGAFFWLNAGSAGDPANRRWPSAPLDTFAALGFQEQKVIVIPSRNLVLVRFGATSDRSAWDTDEFIANVLAALPS